MNGDRFGPYELRELVGRGGMGEVYRAVDTRKNRGLVALKRLPAGLASDIDFQRRFLREAELAARLRDPHVIPIHDYGEIDGQPYLDMRLVDGIDLATHLREQGPLAPDRAVEVVGQVADALDAAHREGLVHRDVKPQNVLVNRPDGGARSDFVYLIDFGIAANLLSSKLSSSMVSGTAAYMAPERFTTGGDHRVDVYALGCVLFEVLTGRPPFSGDFVQLMWAHVNVAPPRVSAVRSGLPAVLDDVVAAAMAKNPDARPSTAGAVAGAARQALSGWPSTPPAVGPGRHPVGTPRAAGRPSTPVPSAQPPVTLGPWSVGRRPAFDQGLTDSPGKVLLLVLSILVIVVGVIALIALGEAGLL